MTLRLGFCGVGRWARKLAESFRACGAEVVAFDRKGMPGAHTITMPGFGKFMPWRDQLADKNIDAIVAVAPPEITTQVALACAEAGKAVMATKPLFDHPATIRAPFYVDFVRLFSDAHVDLRTRSNVSLVLKGSGPVRGFPGMFDYGPHVSAALLDIANGRSVRLVDHFREDCPTGEVYRAQWIIGGELPGLGGAIADAEFGNGASEGVRSMTWGDADGTEHTTHETPTHIGSQLKSDVMKAFCQSFLNDVSEGFVDTKLLNYSREGMKLLEQVRRMAT